MLNLPYRCRAEFSLHLIAITTENQYGNHLENRDSTL